MFLPCEFALYMRKEIGVSGVDFFSYRAASDRVRFMPFVQIKVSMSVATIGKFPLLEESV